MSISADMNLPLGLKRLAELHSLEVHSAWSWTSSSFEIRQCSGELLFSCSQKPVSWISSGRSFDLTLLDTDGVEVINIRRTNSFCLSTVEVRVQGSLASSVRQKATWFKPLLEITDAAGTPVYRMKGPWQQASDLKYQLTTLDKAPLGAVTRRRSGWRLELVTVKENFIVTFPQELSLEYKAACIAAAVFINHTMRSRRCT